MNKNVMHVKLTFVNDILGTANSDPDIHERFIASNAPDAPSRKEEIEAIGVEKEIEKGKTVFPRDEEGNPILWTYQIKGFFKSACSAMSKVSDTLSGKITAYKKYVDTQIFVYADAKDRTSKSRQIVIHTDSEVDDLQRPLRAQTMQGERVALANSERIHEGAYVYFDIVLLTAGAKAKVKEEEQKELIREWLNYGEFNGIGQWRNAGYGSFLWEEFDDNGNKIAGNT